MSYLPRSTPSVCSTVLPGAPPGFCLLLHLFPVTGASNILLSTCMPFVLVALPLVCRSTLSVCSNIGETGGQLLKKFTYMLITSSMYFINYLYWNGHNLFVYQLIRLYLCVRWLSHVTSDVIRTNVVRRRPNRMSTYVIT